MADVLGRPARSARVSNQCFMPLVPSSLGRLTRRSDGHLAGGNALLAETATAGLANAGQNRNRRPPETMAPPNLTSVVTPVCSSAVAKKPSSGSVIVAEARLYRASHPTPT